MLSSCSKSRFRAFANRIFGHTDVTHRLVTGQEIAKEKHGLKVGDRVFFKFEGERFGGHLPHNEAGYRDGPEPRRGISGLGRE